VRDVVQAYEAHLAALTAEVVDARNALLAAHRDISDLRDGHDGTKALVEQAALMEQLEKVAMEARHAQLLSRDHVVGIEAEIGRQNADILRLTGDLRRLQGREKRLTSRKSAQAKRIAGLQSKLTAARKDNAALKRRVRELEADLDKPSLARRVVRRLRGPRR
jgi:chromosome segregation ATPase